VAFAFPAVACRLALVLAVDVSGSVDPREYRLQLDGIGAALLDPDVSAQILATPETPVMLAVFEWSNSLYRREIINWIALDSYARLAEVAGILRGHYTRPKQGATAIGSAMLYADAMFERGPQCWYRTIDISGDGTNNFGPEPEDIRTLKAFEQVTINGLVIGSDNTTHGRDERQMEMMELSAYFRSRVIRGANAFIEIAQGFDDFERAMTRKLLRETVLPPIGLRPATTPRQYADLR
jgi:hypothetical protein